jgi:hypothetical protein
LAKRKGSREGTDRRQVSGAEHTCSVSFTTREPIFMQGCRVRRI